MVEVGHDVMRAVQLIRDGELVAFGTETVYGLGADATNARAVAKVFEAKSRPSFDPLISHVADTNTAQRVCREWSASAAVLADAFWPGPLTLVVPKALEVVDLATSGLPTTGVRVPRPELTREFLVAANCPVAAPSANLFGMVSPTTAAHVVEQLGHAIAYVLDTGPCEVGLESTVVRLTGEDAVVLRPGGVTFEELADVLPTIRTGADADRGEMQAPDSPGQLPNHYSPGVPIRRNVTIIAAGEATLPIGLLAFGELNDEWHGPVEQLSATGDLLEAASNLFASLRSLAARGVERIDVMPIPDVGIGVAINDRLKRAAQS